MVSFHFALVTLVFQVASTQVGAMFPGGGMLSGASYEHAANNPGIFSGGNMDVDNPGFSHQNQPVPSIPKTPFLSSGPASASAVFPSAWNNPQQPDPLTFGNLSSMAMQGVQDHIQNKDPRMNPKGPQGWAKPVFFDQAMQIQAKRYGCNVDELSRQEKAEVYAGLVGANVASSWLSGQTASIPRTLNGAAGFLSRAAKVPKGLPGAAFAGCSLLVNHMMSDDSLL